MAPLLKRAIATAKSPMTVYLVAAIACRSVQIILIPLYTRRLTIAEYGDLVLAQTAMSLLPVLLTVGLASAVPRTFYREKDPVDGFREAGHVGAWIAVLSVVSGLILVLATVLFLPKGFLFGKVEVCCVIVSSVGSAITAVPSVLYRATQRALIAAGFQGWEALSLGLFTILFVVGFGLGLRGALLGSAVAYSVNALPALYVIFGICKGRPVRGRLRDLVRFSFPLVPHFLANWAQATSDRWVLKAAGLDATVGAFALANQVLSPANMTTTAFNDYASPKLGEALRDDGPDAFARVCRSQRRQYLLSNFFPAAACVLLTPVAVLIVGKAFSTAFWTLPIIALIGLIDTQYYPNSNVLYFAEKTGLIPRVTITAAIANVVLNLALIPFLGLPGALLARGLSVAGRALAVYFLAQGTLRSQPVPAPEAS